MRFQTAVLDADDVRTKKLASLLALPLVAERTEKFAGFLRYDAESLVFSATVDGEELELSIDFSTPAAIRRICDPGFRADPLLRAVGKPAALGTTTIFDASLGFAFDSLRLAFRGFRVVGAERNPIVRSLTENGLARAGEVQELSSVLQRVEVLAEDSITELAKRADESSPEIVYIDPMFPSTNKQVKRRKEMVVLRLLAGTDEDAADLVSLARTVALQRVVVKLPLKAQALAEPPNHSIHGKSHRFDVYLRGT